jgi:hypothetical protein
MRGPATRVNENTLARGADDEADHTLWIELCLTLDALDRVGLQQAVSPLSKAEKRLLEKLIGTVLQASVSSV